MYMSDGQNEVESALFNTDLTKLFLDITYND